MKEDKKYKSVIEIISFGMCECINEPLGNCRLEGYNIREEYKFEKCRKKGMREKYYRIYTNEGFNYYDTCGPAQFTEHFKIIGEEGVK